MTRLAIKHPVVRPPGIFIAKDKKIGNFRIIRFRSKYKNKGKGFNTIHEGIDWLFDYDEFLSLTPTHHLTHI